MAMVNDYAVDEPPRTDVDSLSGATVIEFGSPWCGHCRIAQQPLTRAFAQHPAIRHIKIEDGPGQPLGRSFRVKLWPTFVFLKDGTEVTRVVRPRAVEPLLEAMDQIDS